MLLASSDAHVRFAFRFEITAGPAHSRFGTTCCPEWPTIGQNFPDRHLEQFSFGGISTAFLKRPYFLLGMHGCEQRRLSIIALKAHHGLRFLLNQGMSRTLRGILSVSPLRPSSDFFDGSVFFAADVALEAVVFAVFVAFEAVFFAAAFAFAAVFLEAAAVFLAVDVALEAVVFAAEVAFVAVAFVAFFPLSAAFAAAPTFFATAALSPASCSFFAPAPATLLTESNFAATSFFAVAAPIPGSAVNASILEGLFLLAIVSLASP